MHVDAMTLPQPLGRIGEMARLTRDAGFFGLLITDSESVDAENGPARWPTASTSTRSASRDVCAAMSRIGGHRCDRSRADDRRLLCNALTDPEIIGRYGAVARQLRG